MPFMLGSFSDGMFGGMRSVGAIYGAYQQLQQQKLGLDAAKAVQTDQANAARDGSLDDTINGLRQPAGADPVPASDSSTDPGIAEPPDTTGGQPVADPGQVPDPDLTTTRDGALAQTIDKLRKPAGADQPSPAAGAEAAGAGADGRRTSTDPSPAAGADIAASTPAGRITSTTGGLGLPAAAAGATPMGVPSPFPGGVNHAEVTPPSQDALRAQAIQQRAYQIVSAAGSAKGLTARDLQDRQQNAIAQATTEYDQAHPRPAPAPQLGPDGRPKIPALDFSSWSARAQQNYPPAPPAPGTPAPTDIPGVYSSTTPPPAAEMGETPRSPVGAGLATPMGAAAARQGAIPGVQTSNTPPPAAEMGEQPGTPPGRPVTTGVAPPAPPAAGQAGLGGRILGLLGQLNPIGTAQAAEAPPTAAPAPVPTGPGGEASTHLTSVVNPFSALHGATTVGTPSPAAPPASVQVQPAPAAHAALPPAAAGAPVSVPASRDPVAPGQQGPTTQSEPAPARVIPPFDHKPWAALLQQAPQYARLVEQVATQEHVDPARLAWHWWKEGGFRTQVPTGAAGELGATQVMPATARMLDPKGTLNPVALQGSLTLAARNIFQLDTRYGKNAPLSFAAYQGGSGSADAIAGGQDAHHPNTVAYMRAAFPGRTIGPENYSPPIEIDPQGAVQAGTQGGPDGFIHYIASSGPANVSMGDKWRATETALMALAASKGDVAGMQQARDFALQMAQQGSTSSLIAAYKALQNGDGVTASQQLARAHAFFPDGTMGRFGVDKSGAVWAQRVDENDPSRALGGHFQITPEKLQDMMIQTQDPNRYLQMVREQQKTASELSMNAAHGQWYKDQVQVHRDQITMHSQDLRFIADQNNTQRAAAATEAARSRIYASAVKGLEAAELRAAGDPARDREIDGEVGKLYRNDGGVSNDLTTEQNGDASQIHQDIRRNSPIGITGPMAYELSTGVVQGRYAVWPAADGQSYGVYEKGNTDGPPVAVLSKMVGARIAAKYGARRAALPAAVRTSSSAQPVATVH